MEFGIGVEVVSYGGMANGTVVSSGGEELVFGGSVEVGAVVNGGFEKVWGRGSVASGALVSPDHAICIDGVLVQAGALVNGVMILRESDVPEVFTYYHVELATHELLLAEGAATESFVDNVDRMHFSNWAEHEALGDIAPIAEMPHPRVKSQRQTPMALRRKLAARVALAFGEMRSVG